MMRAWSFIRAKQMGMAVRWVARASRPPMDHSVAFDGGRDARPTQGVRGFSLIEVLVSILILGLGLLGLGALFPVVVREQREASDRVLGIIATNNIQAMLNASASTTVPSLVTRDSNGNVTSVTYGPSGWRNLLENWLSQSDMVNQPGRANFLWEPKWNFPGDTLPNGAPPSDQNYQQTGNILYVGHGLPPTGTPPVSYVPQPLSLPLSSRLVTVGDVGNASPQFVWDVAPRYTSGNRVEVAVFVRRLDAGIRVPSGRTLRQTVLDASLISLQSIFGGSYVKLPDQSEDRLPVGAMRVPGDATKDGQPTLDGTDGNGGLNYSMILEAIGPYSGMSPVNGTDFDVDPNDPRWLVGIKKDTVVGQAIAQPGQRLVDNLDNIYTVEKVEDDPNNTGMKRVRINPAVSSYALTVDVNAHRPLKQFVLTPQVPVGVFVMEVAR